MAAPKGVTVHTGALIMIAQNDARTRITFQNNTGVAVFIGETSGVTTANGYSLANNAEFTRERTEENKDYFYSGDYYAIIASGSQTLIVWEEEKIR